MSADNDDFTSSILGLLKDNYGTVLSAAADVFGKFQNYREGKKNLALGYNYEDGQNGYSQNNEEAFKCYKKAFECGNEDAKYALGRCYLYGIGISVNHKAAFALLKPYAEEGNVTVQRMVGDCFFYDGNMQDYSKAVYWYTYAANGGDKFAQNNLGLCYYCGSGVSQNYQEAVKWLTYAVHQFNYNSVHILGDCYYNGTGVEKNYSEAIRLYLLYGNKENNHSVSYNLGNCYYNGLGIGINYSEAVKWYTISANLGNDKAQYELGNCYYFGNGVNRDRYKAYELYILSQKSGNKDAIKMIIRCEEDETDEIYDNIVNGNFSYDNNDYIRELGIKKTKSGIKYKNGEENFNQDYLKAFKCFVIGATCNYNLAQQYLGDFYYEGIVIEQDYIKAAKLYKEAVDKGNIEAQYKLGNCYYYGHGVDRNRDKAYKLYISSDKNGNKDAKKMIIQCDDEITNEIFDDIENHKSIFDIYDDDIETLGIKKTEEGINHKDGINGFNKDLLIAFKCFSIGNTCGNAAAKKYLADFYYEGISVEKDYNKAAELYKEAVEKGNIEAQYKLGNCYYYGYGVIKSREKAYDLYVLANKNGNKDAKKMIIKCDDNITDELFDDIENNRITFKTNIEDTKKLGSKKLEEGINHKYGINGFNKDLLIAFKCFSIGALCDNTTAKKYLGDSYYEGIGTKRDYSKAAIWYEDAAKHADTEAQYKIANCYYNGLGVEQDYNKAVNWYTISANQGYEEAQKALGRCYFNGNGVKKDYVKSAKMYAGSFKQKFMKFIKK